MYPSHIIAENATRLKREPEADGVDVVEAYGAQGTAMVVPQGAIEAEVPMALFTGSTAKALPKVPPILTSRKQGVA